MVHCTVQVSRVLPKLSTVVCASQVYSLIPYPYLDFASAPTRQGAASRTKKLGSSEASFPVYISLIVAFLYHCRRFGPLPNGAHLKAQRPKLVSVDVGCAARLLRRITLRCTPHRQPFYSLMLIMKIQTKQSK